MSYRVDKQTDRQTDRWTLLNTSNVHVFIISIFYFLSCQYYFCKFLHNI